LLPRGKCQASKPDPVEIKERSSKPEAAQSKAVYLQESKVTFHAAAIMWKWMKGHCRNHERRIGAEKYFCAKSKQIGPK
jgi:hypothetical protein